MKITIAERLKPFCHLPGTACMVPWSAWRVQIFPALIKFSHMVSGEEGHFGLDWKGPVLDFTAQLDLEKGRVEVFGHTAEGYRRALILMEEEGLTLVQDQKKSILARGEKLSCRPVERLSLGSHKALDWELVRRRKDLKEILPVWHHLGQMVPLVKCEKIGTAALLQRPDKMVVEKEYLKLFLAGFESMMVPTLSDVHYQGIVEDKVFKGSPLGLLTEGRELIRSLFFQERSDGWAFLPCLPPQFHAGRFLNLRTEDGDEIDFEWSKKALRRVVIRPRLTKEIHLLLQKPLISFRHGGERWLASQLLRLEAGKTFKLDRFEK